LAGATDWIKVSSYGKPICFIKMGFFIGSPFEEGETLWKMGYLGEGVVRFLGVKRSMIVRAAHSEEMPEIPKYLQAHP